MYTHSLRSYYKKMLIIIRNEEKLSLKTNFVVQLFRQNSNDKVFYVFKREREKFRERWYDEEIQLPFSTIGLIMYYLQVLLKSPGDTHKGLLTRLSHKKQKHILTEKGFLSILSRALYLRFGTSARANKLIHLLTKVSSPKVFLIDEFLSLNFLDLKSLRLLGPIIYVSQDIAYNRFGFADNFVTRKLMFRLERDAVVNVDLVVACSEMERLKYLEMGAKKAIFYPNIYPTIEFDTCSKDEMPSICIVLREHWGSKAKQSLETIFNALARIDRQIRVYLIGIKPQKVPKNITLKHFKFIPSKLNYLKVLSSSWIGINVGIHKAGTNERKYDYAEAGIVVLSDYFGSRGDLLPHEYTYIDGHDLTAKIEQLLQFGKKSLEEMGKKNRNHVLFLANKKRKNVLAYLDKSIFKTK